MADEVEFAFRVKEVGTSFVWALFEGGTQTEISSEETFATEDQAAQDARNFQAANYAAGEPQHDAPVLGSAAA
jgi:hypothetical protein